MAKTAEDRRTFALMAAIIAVALVLSALVPGRTALGEELPDPSRTDCSIDLTLKDSKGTALSGGELTIYRVAQIKANDTGYHFFYMDGFGDTDTELTKSQVENPSKSFIDGLVKSASKATGTTQTIASDGSVSFKDLETGVYLVVQTKATSGYEAINSFLVSVPYNNKGTLVYNLDSSIIKAKVGTITKTTTPNNPSNPKTPTTPSYTHTSSAKLPQTGQLWWPVWVLGGLGAALVLVGLVVKSRSGQKSDPVEA